MHIPVYKTVQGVHGIPWVANCCTTGFAQVRNRSGDQLVKVVVEVPKKLSEEQEELLRRLAELEEKEVGSKRHSFFEKLRRAFD